MAKLRGIKAEKRRNANAWVVRQLSKKQRDMLALLGLKSRSEAAIVQTKSLPRQLLFVQRRRSPSTQFLYWLKSSSTMQVGLRSAPKTLV